MKKLSAFLMFFLIAFFALFTAANATLVTTFSFDGQAVYGEDLSFANDLGVTLTDINLDREAPYNLVGMVNLNFDWNLPEWDAVCDWTIDVNAIAAFNGTNLGSYNDTFSLGEFALVDHTAVIAYAYNYLASVPLQGYDATIGGYYLDNVVTNNDFFGRTILESGTLYLALEQPFLNICDGPYSFSGSIALDANPVPEPATMLLLGSGLIGLAGLGRKKFFKKS